MDHETGSQEKMAVLSPFFIFYDNSVCLIPFSLGIVIHLCKYKVHFRCPEALNVGNGWLFNAELYIIL